VTPKSHLWLYFFKKNLQKLDLERKIPKTKYNS